MSIFQEPSPALSREAWPMRVQLSLAAYPRRAPLEAMELALGEQSAGTLGEAVFGPIHLDHVQLVAQSAGWLHEDLCHALRERYPEVRFRLHANARVAQRHVFADLSSAHAHWHWFEKAARVSRLLRAQAYTAHSGRRGNASVREMLENTRRLVDLFECRVGVEGQYPSGSERWLIDSWQEYRLLFDSGVDYAIDLSHLNIVARHAGRWESTLLREMLACERCIEVHLSDNDGRGDWHQTCEHAPAWQPLLPFIHPKAVVFTEGNRLYRRELRDAKDQ